MKISARTQNQLFKSQVESTLKYRVAKSATQISYTQLNDTHHSTEWRSDWCSCSVP